MQKIKFYLKCFKWLWKNRHWAPTRQKLKALIREVGVVDDV